MSKHFCNVVKSKDKYLKKWFSNKNKEKFMHAMLKGKCKTFAEFSRFTSLE